MLQLKDPVHQRKQPTLPASTLKLSILLLLTICSSGFSESGLHKKLSGFFDAFCLDCHNATDATAGLDLESLDLSIASNDSKWPQSDTATWEKIAKRLQAGQMPPIDADRPSDDEYRDIVAAMHTTLDQAAEKFPSPGRMEHVRRLNRSEYRNAIRDLTGLKVDVTDMLPGDASGHGFDNVTVSGLSPALVSRYITAAERIARQTVGASQKGSTVRIVRLPADRTQQSMSMGCRWVRGVERFSSTISPPEESTKSRFA